ncbi:hypothetical protein [Caulobacter sp. NIBR2454]|uniref:hypothetical protein n=1 Tax=Caulobacter sp. NIBR2454 TaxID=3015996 RepID=UPI0022B67CE9|nr:hypothetical protein [Caulobacter sp. NIBR2454]
MSLPLDDMIPEAPRFGPLPVRPFLWSLRRELWEHKAIWIAPAAVAALVFLGFVLGSFGLAERVREAEAGSTGAANRLMLPYAVSAGASFVAALLAGAYYCLGSLYNERRDRSILFWKSLPVSDLTSVLSKAAVPLLVQPVAVFGIILATHLAMLIWGTIAVLLSNTSPVLFWTNAFPGFMWLVTAYSLPFLALWNAPIVAWLILVSAWAKRVPFLWAIFPPVMLGILERMVLDTSHVLHFLNTRLFGGMAHTFSISGAGARPIRGMEDVNITSMLADPNLWIGLVLAAAMLAGAAWLRRHREPI